MLISPLVTFGHVPCLGIATRPRSLRYCLSVTGTTFNKPSDQPRAAEPEAISRTRRLLKAKAARVPFDPEVGYLELIGDRREPVTPATIAMQMPIVSAIYERWWRPGLTRIAKGIGGPSMSAEYASAQELLRVRRGDRVLDLACGPGNFSRRFARAVAPEGLVVGYDGSRSMLERAVLEARREGDETMAASLAFVHGEATELPFKANSFQSVCCFAALHMFPKPFRTLAEVGRVLEPGGRIALLTSNVSGGGLPALAAHAFGFASGMKMFTEEQIRSELESLGFEVEAQQAAGATQLVSAVLR